MLLERAQAAITAIESREKIHLVHGEPKRGRGMHKKRLAKSTHAISTSEDHGAEFFM